MSKNLDDQTEVHSGKLECKDSAKIEETVKTRQNSTKMVIETLFSGGFSNFIQFGLNLSAPTYQSGLQFGLPDFLTHLSSLKMRVNSGDT